MKPKKLIEVALPIKEISAESVRDKSIRHGHISTLHLWWARRPLPVCRAIVFASLVPDPLDENCPEAFKWAVEKLLGRSPYYRPYDDIPYTAIYDPMEENHRNRLMMFIGRFSPVCESNMKAGKSTPPKDQLSDGSLIKWENKNNEKILRIARELIFVAYQSDRRPEATYEQLHEEFNNLYNAIPTAEQRLYSLTDRHINSSEVQKREAALKDAIDVFQAEMPSVFDPFAGGGAIPLEAARLGCRSFGNDINPVAHIIERGSAEFPQRFGKPIVMSAEEFDRIYGEEGKAQVEASNGHISFDGLEYHIPNRLAFDVEFYARKILRETEKEVGYLYPTDEKGNKPVAYYWARTARCSNPTCGTEVPLLKQLYLANTSKKKVYLNPIIKGNDIQFEISEGKCIHDGFMKTRECSISCPCCGNITSATELKRQFRSGLTKERLLAVISESEKGKTYRLPSIKEIELSKHKIDNVERPAEMMQVGNQRNFNTPGWGIDKYGQLFSDRQMLMLNTLLRNYLSIKDDLICENNNYVQAIITYLAIWIDRIAIANTSFGVWHTGRETLERIMGRQAIPMTFDYPESNPFCESSGSALNQLDWLYRYFESESDCSFAANFANASSGERGQFEKKSLTAVVTDPPYYDAIAYADISDFFYVWLKRTLGTLFPLNFATPQTPKTEECTALKHHHNNSVDDARKHFENKLTEIFDAIEIQTSDVVSIMYAHQSTEAWTTLCNSILGARMNITGSWPMDTEMQGALKTEMAYLESSVTVACRPSERKGYADYGEVKHEIRQVVKAEVEKLYALGFRGADLLTACFGQAVSVFGHYKSVETAEGDPVSVGQLLEYARESANLALLEGVPGEAQTKFYCGWLQMNGMGDASFDDVNKYTRVGVNIEIRQLQAEHLLITDGNRQHLATAEEHLSSGEYMGSMPEHTLIAQAHRLMLAYLYEDKNGLLQLVNRLCPQSDSPLWRLLAFLKEHLPAGKDLNAVQGLLLSEEQLIRESKLGSIDRQQTLDFE